MTAVRTRLTKNELAFGQLLKLWRRRCGRSLRLVAERLGVSHTYVSEIETGKRRAPCFTVNQLVALEGLLDLDRTDIAIAAARSRGRVELHLDWDDVTRAMMAVLLQVRWSELSKDSVDRILAVLENPRR